jgi:HAMP domain-containing protein
MINDAEQDKSQVRDATMASSDDQPIASDQMRMIEGPFTAIQRGASRSPFLGRRFKILSSISVRYKIAGTLIVVLSLAAVSLGVVTFTRQNSILRYEMKSRAEILVQQLANVGKEGLLTKQELPVYSTITDIQKRNDVVYAMVLDYEGRVFAHSDFKKKGKILTGPFDQTALKASALLFQETGSGNDTVLDAAVPVVLKGKNLKIGIARIGLSEKVLNESINKQKRIYLWMTIGFVVAGLLVSFALARVLTKPLDSLAEGMQVVARGDLRKLVSVRFDDEIGKLTNAFNQMVLSLREKLLMEKYLSQPTVQSIKEHRDVTQLKLGGERKYVTALFSDARGFTSLSEKMSPEEVVRLMNVYLNLQAKVMRSWQSLRDGVMRLTRSGPR